MTELMDGGRKGKKKGNREGKRDEDTVLLTNLTLGGKSKRRI